MYAELAGNLHFQAKRIGVQAPYESCLSVVKQFGIGDFERKLPAMVTQLKKILPRTYINETDFWAANGWLYKQDKGKGTCEGLAAHIASRVLADVTVSGVMPPHVTYTTSWVNGEPGCVCTSYLPAGATNTNLSDFDDICTVDDIEENKILRGLRIDLSVIFLCDVLLFNEARGLDNVAVIRSRKEVQLAPNFSLGHSYRFSGLPPYNLYSPEPFSDAQVQWAMSCLAPYRVVFNYSQFIKKLNRNIACYDEFTVSRYVERVKECADCQSVMEVI